MVCTYMSFYQPIILAFVLRIDVFVHLSKCIFVLKQGNFSPTKLDRIPSFFETASWKIFQRLMASWLKINMQPIFSRKKIEKDSTGVIKLSYDLIIHLGQIKEYKYLTSLSDLPHRFASTNGGSVWFDLMPTWLDFYVL